MGRYDGKDIDIEYFQVKRTWQYAGISVIIQILIGISFALGWLKPINNSGDLFMIFSFFLAGVGFYIFQKHYRMYRNRYNQFYKRD